MPSTDDFLVPSDVDLSTKCITGSFFWGNQILFPIGAGISVLCYFYLFWMYFVIKTPLLKRHPTSLAIYKYVFEFIYVQQFLWLPFIESSKFYDDDLNGPNYFCSSSSFAAYLAFVTQFSMLASELCFLVISLDLRMAYTNPFSSYKQNRVYFATLVLGVSLATAVLLILMGPRVYGFSDLGLLWMQSRRRRRSPNFPKLVLFYFILISIFVYCLWANFQFNKSSEKGFARTVSNRISIMQRSKKYTVGYVAFGVGVLAIEFLSFLAAQESSGLAAIPAYCYCFRGIWALLVIVYSNWNEISWKLMNPFRWKEAERGVVEDVAQEGLSLQPHLNSALRAEILYFTTQGIMYAARAYERQYGGNLPGVGVGGLPEGAGKDLEEHARMYSFDEQGRPSLMLEEAKAPAGSVMRPSLVKRFSNTLRQQAAAAAARDDAQQEVSQNDASTAASLMEIDKLDQKQSEIVSSFLDTAVQEEVESMGLMTQYRSNAGPAQRKSETQALQRKSLPETQTGNISNSSSAQRKAVLSSIPERDPNSSARAEKEKDRTKHYVRNPMSLSRGEEIEMSRGGRGFSQDRPSGGSNSITDSSASTPDRAHEAMDIEFGMKPSSDGPESSLPRWHRINSSSARSTERERDRSEDNSHSTTGEKLKVALQSAMNQFSRVYYSFRFKDFCPALFGRVREMCNIGTEEYARSFETTCKERFSEGRSGAFMFYSSDQRCIVKTTTKDELLALHRILPMYVDYLQANPNSLIVRFLGAHCITMYGVELHFVVMLNFFPNLSMSERYDLKGSWVNRHGFAGGRRTRSERAKKEVISSAPLYQDNDLQHKLSLQPEVIHPLADQIKRDINFLKDLTFMDYSLLIGVKRERFQVVDRLKIIADFQNRANSSNSDDPAAEALLQEEPVHSWRLSSQDMFKRDADGGMHARVVEGPGTYYFGIIDILQEWNFTKRAERWLKMYCKCLDGDGISAMSPVLYADRFWKRCVIDTFDGIDYDDDYINQPDDDSRGLMKSTNSQVTDGLRSSSITAATFGEQSQKFVEKV